MTEAPCQKQDDGQEDARFLGAVSPRVGESRTATPLLEVSE